MHMIYEFCFYDIPAATELTECLHISCRKIIPHLPIAPSLRRPGDMPPTSVPAAQTIMPLDKRNKGVEDTTITIH